MDVDGAFLDEHVVAPDLVEQLRAREHAFRMRHEEMQQAEFRGADLQRLVVAGQAVRDRVQLQAAHVDDVVGELEARRRSTALMRAISSWARRAW